MEGKGGEGGGIRVAGVGRRKATSVIVSESVSQRPEYRLSCQLTMVKKLSASRLTEAKTITVPSSSPSSSSQVIESHSVRMAYLG